jgi:hypothetical protein
VGGGLADPRGGRLARKEISQRVVDGTVNFQYNWRMPNKITWKRGDSKGVRYARGGRCWCKLSKIAGRYHVAFGWAGEPTAIAARLQTTTSFRHARIMAEGWINDYGW